MQPAFTTSQPPTAAPVLNHLLVPPTPLDRAGTFVLRYGLVLLILWFGLFKFTPTEAAGIQPLFANSPLFAWLYEIVSVRMLSNLVGTAEILIALLVALWPVAPRLSYIGSLGAVLMFVVTLSFLFTTPKAFAVVDGLWVPGGGLHPQRPSAAGSRFAHRCRGPARLLADCQGPLFNLPQG